MMKKLLIIDDEENLCKSLSEVVAKEGYDVYYETSPSEAIKRVKEEKFDFILCDILMPEINGMEVLEKVKKTAPESTVIMMSAYGTVETAIECIKKGAYDYISKPFKKDEIILTLKKAEERQRLIKENILLKKQIRKEYGYENIYGKSKAIREIIEKIKKISPYKSTVLITGESGTGKELIARAIHNNSEREPAKFVAVNCAAIPDTLLESELFGYEKGAFTGALYPKKGLIEEADGGTLFLDEIGDLPPPLQVKILRFLQEGEVRKIGGTRTIKVNTRIIAATSKNLEEDIKTGKFREDLYYRINVIHIHIPPLRERKEDIPVLVDKFIKNFSEKLKKEIKGITPSALKILMDYPWPGNVRELENQIERAIVLTENEMLTDNDFPDIKNHLSRKETLFDSGLSIKTHTALLEKELITKALKETRGNKSRAAKLLQISLRTLLYKMKEYGIEQD